MRVIVENKVVFLWNTVYLYLHVNCTMLLSVSSSVSSLFSDAYILLLISLFRRPVVMSVGP